MKTKLDYMELGKLYGTLLKLAAALRVLQEWQLKRQRQRRRRRLIAMLFARRD